MAARDPRVEQSGRAPAAAAPMSPMQWLILALRAVMETGIVVGLAYCRPIHPVVLSKTESVNPPGSVRANILRSHSAMTCWFWANGTPVSGESAAWEERELDLGKRVDLLGAPLLLPGGLCQ